jgi:purine nucleoside permease
MSVSTAADIAGIAPGTPVVGKIFADYCGYRTQMSPAWQAMSADPRVAAAGVTILNIQKDNANPQTNADVIVAAINSRLVTKGAKLTYSTVPRIFKIHDGAVSYHEGGRDAAALVKFATGKPAARKPAWHGGRRRRRTRRGRVGRRSRRGGSGRRRFSRINFANARSSPWSYSADD